MIKMRINGKLITGKSVHQCFIKYYRKFFIMDRKLCIFDLEKKERKDHV
jgi:hypothetical protein